MKRKQQLKLGSWQPTELLGGLKPQLYICQKSEGIIAKVCKMATSKRQPNPATEEFKVIILSVVDHPLRFTNQKQTGSAFTVTRALGTWACIGNILKRL